MGIETALFAGAGLVGNYIKKKGEQKAAKAQANAITNAADKSAQTQMDMYNQGQQAVQPYQQAGTQALNQMQGLMTQQGQNEFASEYTSGPMYQMMLDQGIDANLRAASATGGMRTGEAKVGLSTIAPQLINQAYSQKMTGLQGLVNQGASSAGQTASLATSVGSNVGSTQYQGGVTASQPQYDANTAMSDFTGNAISSMGGLAYDQINQFKNAPTQTMTRPGQTYGR